MYARVAFFFCAIALLAVSSAPGSAAVAKFPYVVTNQTNTGARIILRNEDCKPGTHCPLITTWVPARTRESIGVRGSVHYNVMAQFLRQKDEVIPLAVVQTELYVEHGSEARLVEANGRYFWEP